MLFDPKLLEIGDLRKVTLLSSDSPNPEPAEEYFHLFLRSDFSQFSVTRPHGQKISSKNNKLSSSEVTGMPYWQLLGGGAFLVAQGETASLPWRDSIIQFGYKIINWGVDCIK